MIFIVRDVFIEAATGGVLYKKLFLRISQYSQEATVLESLFSKGLQFIKKRLWYRCFPVDIAKILRTTFLKNICKPLLLYLGPYQLFVMKFFAKIKNCR